MQRSDLPFGSEFSPSQISLVRVLELAKKNSGDWRALERAIRAEYFEKNRTSDYNKGKLANNTKLGMIAYGVLDREGTLTDVGEHLYSLRMDADRLYEELGRHILRNLNGVSLVQCILDMKASGETVDLVRLREWLEERGIHFPRGGKHPSMMRLWLEKAGVFTSKWVVDEQKFRELAGLSMDEVDILGTFTPEQKAYIKTLANMGGSGPYSSNDIERLAAITYGIKFNEKNLPKQVLYPLETAGYIQLVRGTKARGRGAKPFQVTPTSRLDKDVIGPILAQLEAQTSADLRPFLRKALSDILTEMKSKNRHRRGLALEALAFKLMRLLDLTYVATRLRGEATGGAEVDVIFESSRLVFSRWQVQCKNTERVSLDDVAKEVGLTHFLKTNVIVVVTTGKIGNEARKYANKVMTDSNLCIVMMDGDDVKKTETNLSAIVDVFNREAKEAMKLKALVI